MDMAIDLRHPTCGDPVVLALVVLGQLDEIPIQMIDGAKLAAVGTNHRHVIADFAGIDLHPFQPFSSSGLIGKRYIRSPMQRRRTDANVTPIGNQADDRAGDHPERSGNSDFSYAASSMCDLTVFATS